ncbi:MAG: hypothetical protein WC511_02430 [Candidatus Pacearchaeota archaeon]
MSKDIKMSDKEKHNEEMPKQYLNFLKERGNWFEHLFLTAITKTKFKGLGLSKILSELPKSANGFEVKLSIEGFELPIKEVCEEWEKQLDMLINKRAKEYLNTRKFRFVSRVTRVLDRELDKIRLLKEEIFDEEDV